MTTPVTSKIVVLLMPIPKNKNKKPCIANHTSSGQSEAVLGKGPKWPYPVFKNTWRAPGKILAGSVVPTGIMLKTPVGMGINQNMEQNS